MKTHICVVADQSGSMHPLRDDTIGSYNQYLAEQRSAALPGDTWTLVLFNTELAMPVRGWPVADVAELTPETYRPRGDTALLDAVARAVEAMDGTLGPGDRALVVVITDGKENASRTATKAGVRELIRAREATGAWTFAYIGADPSTYDEAVSLGIARQNVSRSEPTTAGTRTSYSALNVATNNLRAAPRGRTAAFFAGVPGAVTPAESEERGEPPR
jgi:hypothetical protein